MFGLRSRENSGEEQIEREALRRQFLAARGLVIGRRWEEFIDVIVQKVLPYHAPALVKSTWQDYMAQLRSYEHARQRGELCFEPPNPFYQLVR
jgi:hypothetical protein